MQEPSLSLPARDPLPERPSLQISRGAGPRRRRTRILYLIDHAVSTGGAERLAVGLATHLPLDRFEPWVCATRYSDDATRHALDEAGVRHLTLDRRAKWDVHRLRGLVTILARQRFDILHAHMFGSSFWGSVIGTTCRTPAIIAHEHGFDHGGSAVRAWVDANVIGRLVTRYVAVSRADADEIVGEGVSREKVVVIPNGYIPSTSVTDTDIRMALGGDREAPMIGVAAVLRPEKRLDLLLEAHARVLTAVPGTRLVIAGEGACRPALERRARELGTDGLVHFLGRRHDVDSILRAADVAALSSDREGSPLLMFECMANGTPLVATAVGGIPDIVENGHTGILVPRRDPEALARALADLLTNPSRREAIAAAARERLPQYTMAETAHRFIALYDTLLPDPA